jgi:tetratricopeptide (TPR) repeat protein
VQFLLRRTLGVFALTSLCTWGAFAQAQQKNWKDRAEYDLYESITKEQNANTKLGLLQSWKDKYPTSEYKDARAQMFIDTYRALGKGKEMMDAAKELVATDPKNITGLYWMNLLTISLNDSSPAALDTGEKAGKALLEATQTKPAGQTDEAWAKAKPDLEQVSYRALGWVAMQRNQNDEAEANFTKVLQMNPNDAQVSLWMGTAILKQRKVEKQSAGLYYLTHAAYHEGTGALPDATRKQLMAFVEKSYVNFHGDKAGLDQIVEMTKKSPIPPADLKIESKDEILVKQEEELKKTNPNLALWVGMKRELSGANGATYFDNTLKNSQIPGGVDVGGTKVDKMKGKVVSTKPGPKVKEIVVGISSPDMSEITLRFENPMNVKIDPGTELEFSGVPVEFTPDPFNLVFDVDPKDVVGLPKVTAPPPARKAPPKAAPKK